MIDFGNEVVQRTKNQSGDYKQRETRWNDPIEQLIYLGSVAGVACNFSSSWNVKSIGNHETEIAHNDSKKVNTSKELGTNYIA